MNPNVDILLLYAVFQFVAELIYESPIAVPFQVPDDIVPLDTVKPLIVPVTTKLPVALCNVISSEAPLEYQPNLGVDPVFEYAATFGI